MPRPPVNSTGPMTAAERMARYRERHRTRINELRRQRRSAQRAATRLADGQRHVRITQLDGALPSPALMKPSAWHKTRGDIVHFSRSPYRSPTEPDYAHVYGSALLGCSTTGRGWWWWRDAHRLEPNHTCSIRIVGSQKLLDWKLSGKMLVTNVHRMPLDGQNGCPSGKCRFDRGKAQSAKRTTYGAAMLIAVLVGIGVGNARAQTDPDVAAVTAANNAFYTAMSGLDAAAMDKVWAPETYITNIGPRSKAVTIGSPVVQNDFKDFFTALAQMVLKPVDPQVHVNGSVAWAVGLETGEAKSKDGASRAITNLVTNIFEKRNGRWLLVSHQAQAIPQ